MLTVGKLIEAIQGKEYHPLAIPITSVVIDSRLVKAGALFVALPGENQDVMLPIQYQALRDPTLGYTSRVLRFSEIV